MILWLCWKSYQEIVTQSITTARAELSNVNLLLPKPLAATILSTLPSLSFASHSAEDLNKVPQLMVNLDQHLSLLHHFECNN